jgi:hypothetical protein
MHITRKILLVGLFAIAPMSSCTLITEPDRDKIPAATGGSKDGGGTGGKGGTGGTVGSGGSGGSTGGTGGSDAPGDEGRTNDGNQADVVDDGVGE